MRKITIAVMALFVVVLVAGTVAQPVSGQELPPGGTFIDDDGNTHEGYIEAVAAAGITAGCNEAGTRYCPFDPVTRAQMATFLARALGLTDTNHPDAFGDDDGSVHEPWINAMAALGITSGCSASDPTRYCPDEPVDRAQMATFLVRALPGIAPATSDTFSDDDGSVHEPNIDGLAAAGVTQGCSTSDPSVFCPLQAVGRDQMATFLGRALGLVPNVPPARVGFICTEVIGFSQTNQWYEPNGGAFEDTVVDAEWQVRTQSGASIGMIAQDTWAAWVASPNSPCSEDLVDRVVLTISGVSGSNVTAWAEGITSAIAQVEVQHPYVREILLQPVVGGPNHALCFNNGTQIRASYQHPFIDQAIGQLAAALPGVEVGYSPEVPDCGGYRDDIGHLTDSYTNVVGATIGEYYATN